MEEQKKKQQQKQKTIEEQGAKQSGVLEALKSEKKLKSIEGRFPHNMRNGEIKNEIYEIKKCEEKNIWKDLKYESVNVNIIFNNMKQWDLLMKAFMLVKLIYTKLRWIKLT